MNYYHLDFWRSYGIVLIMVGLWGGGMVPFNPSRQRKLDLLIKESSELARARLTLHVEGNALSHKLLQLCIVAVSQNLTWPEVSIQAGALLPAHPSGGDYTAIKTACSDLLKCQVHEVWTTSRKFKFRNLFTEVGYDSGVISAVFSDRAEEHILGLKNFFTEFNFFELLSLNSYYTQRLYLLAKSWSEPRGTANLRLSDVYKALSIPLKNQKNFNYLKRKVLDPSVRKIRKEAPDFFFNYLSEKSGVKVTSIRIFCGPKGEFIWRDIQAQNEISAPCQRPRRKKTTAESVEICRRAHHVKALGACSWWRLEDELCAACRLAGVAWAPRPKPGRDEV